MNKVQSANPLFYSNYQHLPQSNAFERFINDFNGAIVFICVQKTQARILRKSHLLKDGLWKIFGIKKKIVIFKTSVSQKMVAQKKRLCLLKIELTNFNCSMKGGYTLEKKLTSYSNTGTESLKQLWNLN